MIQVFADERGKADTDLTKVAKDPTFITPLID
jgi:hypothetical protein